MKTFIFLVSMTFAVSGLADEIDVPKQTWLANLQVILPGHLCKPESPLMRVYKGEDCLADMNALYEKCTTEVDNVVIPDHITSVPQANVLGAVIAECMAAYYQGGQAVETFNLIQSLSRPQ